MPDLFPPLGEADAAAGITGVHPLAALFPPLSEAEYQALREDVSRHGAYVAILVDESGLILDGVHRRRALLAADKPLKVKRTGKDPAQVVLSFNLTRRSLTKSQRAMIGVALYIADKDKDNGRKINLDQAARVVGVSLSTIERAKKVWDFDQSDHAKTFPRRGFAARVSTGSLELKEAIVQIQQVQRQAKPTAVSPPPAISDFEDLITDGPARPDPEPGGDLDTEPVDPPRRSRETVLMPEPPSVGYYKGYDLGPLPLTYEAAVETLVPRGWEAAADVLEVPKALRDIDRSQDAKRVLAVLLHGLPSLSSTAKRALLNEIAASLPKPDLQSWVSAVRLDKGLG